MFTPKEKYIIITLSQTMTGLRHDIISWRLDIFLISIIFTVIYSLSIANNDGIEGIVLFYLNM